MPLTLRLVAQVILAGVAAACATAPPRGTPDCLEFLQPGTTKRMEVVERFGAPYARFEGGRIVAYWLAADAGGLYKPRPHDLRSHSLVLVFRSDDVLERHALVKVRGK